MDKTSNRNMDNKGDIGMKNRFIYFKYVSLAVLCLVVLGLVFVFTANQVVKATEDRMVTEEDATQLEADCILILGAGVHDDGSPSHMLEDRLLQGIALYEMGVADKLLMSGDHGQKGYDEVKAMKQFAIDHGVPSEDVFMDHAGFSTYESLYRARDIFAAYKIIIVTQEYHLYRSLYIADALGLEAYGVASDPRVYLGQNYRELREVAARCKDFLLCVFQPLPTFLGETIPVYGDGNQTND